MKMPKLLTQDYLVGGFVIFILASIFISEGIISGLIYFLGIASVIYLIYILAIGALKTISKDGFDGLVKAAIFTLLKFTFSAAMILTAATLLWVGFKILLSLLVWLKDGFWFYEHNSLCSVFEFNCFPNTGFVKINEFTAWLYGFDVEFWFIAAPWVLAISFWFLDAPSKKNT